MYFNGNSFGASGGNGASCGNAVYGEYRRLVPVWKFGAGPDVMLAGAR